MFDSLVEDLSQRYGLGDRGRDLFGLLMAYIHNDRRGGFGGFIEAFREQGHGELFSSWLGNTQAGGLTASDVGMVFGQGLLNDWGSRLGASRATVAAAIAGVLPRLVAELTPGGRIPGGFAPLAPLLAAEQRRPAASPVKRGSEVPERATGSDPGNLSVRPGVDGLIDEAAPSAAVVGGAPMPPTGDRMHVPAELRETPYVDGPRLSDQPALRREPVFASESPAVRAPVDAWREQEERIPMAPPLDPAEQRLADMAAAFDRVAPPSDGQGRIGDVRPETWRPAVHPPRPRRSGLRWLLWLVLLLAAAAAAGWYAWTQGLLDPSIQQYQLPIRTSPSTH